MFFLTFMIKIKKHLSVQGVVIDMAHNLSSPAPNGTGFRLRTQHVYHSSSVSYFYFWIKNFYRAILIHYLSLYILMMFHILF